MWTSVSPWPPVPAPVPRRCRQGLEEITQKHFRVAYNFAHETSVCVLYVLKDIYFFNFLLRMPGWACRSFRVRVLVSPN